MHKKIVSLFSVTVLASTMFLTGCKKDCECPKPPDPPAPPCTATSTWKGTYSSTTELMEVYESNFINNGIAKLNTSPWSYFWTSIETAIPECRRFSADSVRMDIRAKNPVGEGAIEQLDLSLAIVGELDSAVVTFIGRGTHQQFATIGLWKGANVTNQAELVQLFPDWTEISLEVKNGAISAYKNSTLLKSFTIPAGKKLGKIKKIHAGFKGTGSIDWVKVYDSNSTLKFKEEFNTAKTSTIEWF